MKFETMRGGGPGGQNADRRATAVRLRVPVEELELTPEEERLVYEYLPAKNLTTAGEMLVEASKHRSQARNRQQALKIGEKQLEEALERGRSEKRGRQRKKRVKNSGGRGGGSSCENIHEQRKKQYRSETTEELMEEALREEPELGD